MQIPSAGQPEDFASGGMLYSGARNFRLMRSWCSRKDPGGPESQILNRPSAKFAELDFRAAFKDHARCYRMSVQLALTIH